jgi:ribonuclease Z
MIRYKVRRGRISHVFISHLHGDHYFGLIGLINTFGLLNRQQELHVYGPEPLKEILELQLQVADSHLPFDLHLHSIRQPGILAETEQMKVSCFRTNHRIECYGFLFTEKKNPRRLDPEKARAAGIPEIYFDELTRGKDYKSPEGVVIKNEAVTLPAERGRRYAFCADSKYDETLIPHIKDADLIYHEATYLDNLRERAASRFHSTARQAAELADKAGVKKLLIGHFSSKYDTLEEFEKEARAVFPNTDLAIEGTTYPIGQ